MVSVNTLHYEVEQSLNRIHSGWEKDITSVDIDAYLNRSKDIVLERYDELVEKNRVLEKHLRSLEIVDKEISRKRTGEDFDTFKLPKNYYNYLRIRIKACCKDCQCEEDQEFLTLHYMQQDDINEGLKDPHRNPNFNWRRTIWNLSSEGVNVYHNDFDIKKVYLSYIKYIPDVANVEATNDKSYLGSDGKSTFNENLDLDLDRKNPLWRKIVEIAVYKIKRDLDRSYQENIESIMFDSNVGVN